MRYLLDANVFIQGKNRAYGFDICPGFWDWLESDQTAGRVCSIEKVQDELTAGDDELAAWAGQQGDDFFLPIDPSVIAAFTTVSSWVRAQSQYGQAAANTFFEAADYYLVAYAHAHGHVVVTHETPAPQAKKVKLPTACIGVGVKTMSPWDMLRREKVRFVLAEPGGFDARSWQPDRFFVVVDAERLPIRRLNCPSDRVPCGPDETKKPLDFPSLQ